MRKVTQEIVDAFGSHRKLTIRNTMTDGSAIYLHGNKIAERVGDALFIDSCGWNTVTTRDRLNGLRGVKVSTKLGQMFLNGNPWDGRRVEVSKHTA